MSGNDNNNNEDPADVYEDRQGQEKRARFVGGAHVTSEASGEGVDDRGLKKARADDDQQQQQHQHVDRNFESTPVVFLRALPEAVTEQQLVALARPFSEVLRIVRPPGKGIAFLQLKDSQSARAMIDYYVANPLTVMDKQVGFSSSPHQELRGGHVPGEGGSSGSGSVGGGGGGGYGGGAMGSHGGGAAPYNIGQPSRILLIKLMHPSMPADADLMYRVFAAHGRPARIVLFNKGNDLFTLMEFEHVETATRAMEALQGQSIYPNGVLQMRIQFATQKDSLNIRPGQQDRQKDFTNGPLLEPLMIPLGHAAGQAVGWPAQQPGLPYGAPPMMPGMPGAGGMYAPNPMMGGMGAAGGGMGGANLKDVVLIVSNLDEQHHTALGLAKVFGLYGDVEKLKILREKRNVALIQFTNARGAETAMRYLNQVELFGRPMRIAYSRGGEVQVSPETVTKPESLCIFMGRMHPMHRYAGNETNYQFICAPSERLHISSIPNNMEEADLRRLLEPAGQVVNLKFLPPKRYKQAMVTMGSMQDAFNVIMMIHFLEMPAIDDGGKPLSLRVNFAMTGPRAGGVPGGAGGGGVAHGGHQAQAVPMPGYQPQQQYLPQAGFPAHGGYYAGQAAAPAQQFYMPQHAAADQQAQTQIPQNAAAAAAAAAQQYYAMQPQYYQAAAGAGGAAYGNYMEAYNAQQQQQAAAAAAAGVVPGAPYYAGAAAPGAAGGAAGYPGYYGGYQKK